jgi:hypothetical protein
MSDLEIPDRSRSPRFHGYLPEFGYRVFTEEVLRDSGRD